MGFGQRVARLGGLRQRGSPLLLVVPLGLIVAIVIADVLFPADVHLGPLLIVAPALTASFAGPVATGVVGLLTTLALVLIGLLRSVLTTENLVAQIVAVVLISALVTVFRFGQERRTGELVQVRRVSVAAQQAVLRPLPRRIGPLRVASLYLAAEDQALIGGDLYAAVRTRDGTRLLIGDVMGKGITAMGDAALVLGSFREAAPRVSGPAGLMAYLDRRVTEVLAATEQQHEAPDESPDEGPDEGPDAAAAETAGQPPPGRSGLGTESFVTALLVDVPDGPGPARLVNAGHVPALLLRGGEVRTLAGEPAPPLGLSALAGTGGAEGYAESPFTLEDGDVLLLCTDGVTEARSAGRGEFYPLTDRAAGWGRSGPYQAVRLLHRDLLHHAGGHLKDDAAVVAVQRAPAADDGGSRGARDAPRP